MFLEVHGVRHQFKAKKCTFMVFSTIILGFIISKEGKLPNLKKI
jgi:hypothetical protein